MDKERRVFLIYGEQTIMKGYRLPKSKADIIDSEIKAIMAKYENPKSVTVICKTKEVVTNDFSNITTANIDADIPSKSFGQHIEVGSNEIKTGIFEIERNGPQKGNVIIHPIKISRISINQDVEQKEELRPASEISNSTPKVLQELPKGVIAYSKSTRFFHNQDQTKWYSKFYKAGVWEILEFVDFETCKKYVSDTSASNINSKKK